MRIVNDTRCLGRFYQYAGCCNCVKDDASGGVILSIGSSDNIYIS